MVRTAWDKLTVTAVEPAWSIDEDLPSEVRPARGAGVSQSSRRKSKWAITPRVKECMLCRYEGITIAVVMEMAPEEKPFVAMRKIVQYAHDLEKVPNVARLRTTMKSRLETLVDEKILRAKRILTHSLDVGQPLHTAKWHNQ
jgi:hypothetical protein